MTSIHAISFAVISKKMEAQADTRDSQTDKNEKPDEALLRQEMKGENQRNGESEHANRLVQVVGEPIHSKLISMRPRDPFSSYPDATPR